MSEENPGRVNYYNEIKCMMWVEWRAYK